MKYALLIGNTEYLDQKLAQLKTPEADARALAKVLKSKKIGSFDEVTLIVNQTESKSRRAISAFLANKKPDDLVLLYFSGHGVLDDQGLLYLALKDTQFDLLTGTSLPSSFVTNEMDRCRSKRQILILDCCHSGAFARGVKGQQKAITETTFEGNGFGRVILTASDSTQYALEGDQVIKQSELSLFTHYLLEGLKTGQADRNNDGKISLDEWYDYCYSKVIGITPQQVPHKWSYGQQGDLVIAQNPFVRNGGSAIVSAPLRAMLDQKQLDYEKHRLLLTSKELQIVDEELEKTNFALTDADKQLLLLSALAYGQAEHWLEISGGKALEWLRQSCLDENCPQEARLGAAASLGKMEDLQTFGHMLDCAQHEVDLAKRSNWLDLLTHYLNRSKQRPQLPWAVNRSVMPRLAQRRIDDGSSIRARVRKVAALAAPLCSFIMMTAVYTNARSADPSTPVLNYAAFAFALALLGIMVAYLFAEVLTSLTLMTSRWPLVLQILAFAGIGSIIGIILSYVLSGQKGLWFEGGIIGTAQVLLTRVSIKQSSWYSAIAISLGGCFVFLASLLMIHDVNIVKYWAAVSTGLFTVVYLYAAHRA